MRGKITRPTLPPEKRQEAIEDARAFRRAIRNGIKTERDTQPVQVRMLKAQIAVLKQIAALEQRTTSEIIRMLVDGYIEHCSDTWPDGYAAKILASTISLNGYEEAAWSLEDLQVFTATVTKHGPPEGYDPMTDDTGDPLHPYEQFSEKNAK